MKAEEEERLRREREGEFDIFMEGGEDEEPENISNVNEKHD